MRRFKVTLSSFAQPLILCAVAAQAASPEEAAATLGVNGTKSLEFTGHGHWFQFGQAPRPADEWPQFDVSSYRADIDIENGSADIDIVRKQAVDPKREQPAPANAPAPTVTNPYSVNLYDNIQKPNRDVAQIAALHGPRVATLDDLRTAIGTLASTQ